MKKLTREWVRKAERDLVVVKKIRNAKPPLRDETCFHCQQAGEKYLKALLQEIGLPVRRTHDLLAILDELIPHDGTLKPLRRAARALRRFAVDYRYPGFRATLRQCQASQQHALRIRTEIRARLGLVR
jgi:HEPN domain-containing protein